jgi:hypothetical protein
MSTYKTWVFSELFNERWDAVTKTLRDPIVTLRDIQAKIQAYNREAPRAVSDRNPANFFKDFVRRIDLANVQWPGSVLECGYTAIQMTGGGKAFQFVPLAPGQTEPFLKLRPPADLVPMFVQTLSIQPLARQLGRREETWLMQVAAKLNIIETHLALHSSAKNELVHVELLQLGIKQNLAEIDGLYLGHDERGNGILIPVEAKVRDDIYPSQVYAQAEALCNMRGLQNRNIRRIIPMAIKVTDRATVYVVEFPSVDFAGEAISQQEPYSQSAYVLVPPVSGITA